MIKNRESAVDMPGKGRKKHGAGNRSAAKKAGEGAAGRAVPAL